MTDSSLQSHTSEPLSSSDAAAVARFRAACDAFFASSPPPAGPAAALSTLTSFSPLARAHDPSLYGLTPLTRLPPDHLLPSFHAAKNASRAAAHAASSAAAADALVAALYAPPVLAQGALERLLRGDRDLAASPVALGLARAMERGIGRREAPVWEGERVQVLALGAAGVRLVDALKGDGFDVGIDGDDPGVLRVVSGARWGDWESAGIVVVCGRDSGVIPAGSEGTSDLERYAGAVEVGWRRLLVRAWIEVKCWFLRVRKRRRVEGTVGDNGQGRKRRRLR